MKYITEVLLRYSPPINSLSKKKRAMHRAMSTPQSLLFNSFAARLTEIKKYLFFPVSIEANNMPPEELNYILLHAVPDGWVKQSYLQEWNFEEKIYKETFKMFELMENFKQVYKAGTLYNTTTRADANCSSHSREKREEKPSCLPTPRRAAIESARKNMQDIPGISQPVKTCLLHGPRNLLEE